LTRNLDLRLLIKRLELDHHKALDLAARVEVFPNEYEKISLLCILPQFCSLSGPKSIEGPGAAHEMPKVFIQANRGEKRGKVMVHSPLIFLILISALSASFGILVNSSRAETFNHAKIEHPGTDKPGVHRFELKDGIAVVKVLPNWKASLDLYSMPLQLFGPDHSQDRGTRDPLDTEAFQAERSVIAIIPGPKDDQEMKLSEEDYRKSYPEFLEDRKKDMAEMNSEFVAGLPFETETWKNQKGESRTVLKMGLEFHIEKLYYYDYTYHVPCGKQVYLIKALIPKRVAKLDQNEIKQTLESFSCE